MHHIVGRLFGLLVGTALLLAPVHAAEEKVFSEEQLDQLVAPIALHPDPVVAQILMAVTYPLEIVEAQRWLEKNKGLTDQQLEEKSAAQEWDPSVVSMLHFPEVLKVLGENLDWTQDLGDAVLAQQPDVMAAVQRMRKRAEEEGNLKTTDQQEVVIEEDVIRIEPTEEVIYVPAYNPTVVYGPSWVPTPYYPWYGYPSAYWYPPGYAGAGVVTFGVGMAFGAAIWGNTDWRHGDIDVDVNRNLNVTQNRGNWEHNVEHREGVRYRDPETQNRYEQTARDTRTERIDHDVDRGFEPSVPGGTQAGEFGDSASGDLGSRDRAEIASMERSGGGAESAFSDAGSGTAASAASSRGFSSRGGFSGGGGFRGGRR
jgi:hypothetical protein